MGKRSNFERIERDFYPTPETGFIPLIPHLPSKFTYIEPCAGDGSLVRHIEKHCDASLVEAIDIEPRGPGIIKDDALTHNYKSCDYIITNPPWDRRLLHEMIEKFSDHAPTWLLFDADWIHTKQAAPFMYRLRKVVSVGRLKWIPGSKMTVHI